MKILVTGGAGYIGSHTCVELLDEGYEIIVVDNLVNSKEESIQRVQELTGKKIQFYKIDLLDRDELEKVFESQSIKAVIHFAGLKAMGESVIIPLEYFHNNVSGTLILLKVMKKYNVRNIVFSSTAGVYGEAKTIPITEEFPLSVLNPYSRSKLMIEDILRDLYRAEPVWNIALLRYFNPVGAHPSGQIGEDPNDVPNNLMPYVSQVAVGKLPFVRVWGNDYPTPDGTGIRDYIHVMDLAKGHIKALEKLEKRPGLVTYNLGTGRGFSVMEVISSFEKACQHKIPYKIMGRRPGDAAISYADPTKANRELHWYANKIMDEMCADAWRWQSQNPNGFN
ncbi:MAG: UDP-glucose 4-epimerase GalE [Anaerolineales bacterium]